MNKYTLSLTIASIVAIVSFILSYTGLSQYAANGGKTGIESYLWPILVDGFLIVVSVVQIYASVNRFRLATWLFRGLVLSGVLATVYYNSSYALAVGYSVDVYIVAPIVYFLSLETVLWLAKSESAINHQITENMALSAQKADLLADIGQLDSQRDELEGQYNRQLLEVEQLTQQAIELREAANELASAGEIRVYVPDNLDANGRQQIVSQMHRAGLTQQAMADGLGVSVSTIKNDIRSLNGQLK